MQAVVQVAKRRLDPVAAREGATSVDEHRARSQAARRRVCKVVEETSASTTSNSPECRSQEVAFDELDRFVLLDRRRAAASMRGEVDPDVPRRAGLDDRLGDAPGPAADVEHVWPRMARHDGDCELPAAPRAASDVRTSPSARACRSKRRVGVVVGLGEDVADGRGGTARRLRGAVARSGCGACSARRTATPPGLVRGDAARAGHARSGSRELVGMEVEDRVGRLPADVVQPAPQHRARRDTPVGAAAQREHDLPHLQTAIGNSHSASSSLPRRYGCAGIGRIGSGCGES